MRGRFSKPLPSTTRPTHHIETHYLQISPRLGQVSGPTHHGWANVLQYGGNGEIRTHERDKPLTVFKTVAINRALPRFHMAAPRGFEPRNVGIKIRCLRPTWRKGYKTLQIFKEQDAVYNNFLMLSTVLQKYNKKPLDLSVLGVCGYILF